MNGWVSDQSNRRGQEGLRITLSFRSDSNRIGTGEEVRGTYAGRGMKAEAVVHHASRATAQSPGLLDSNMSTASLPLALSTPSEGRRYSTGRKKPKDTKQSHEGEKGAI